MEEEILFCDNPESFNSLCSMVPNGNLFRYISFGVNIKANFFKGFCFSLFKEDSVYYFVVVTLLSIIISYSILSTLFKIAETNISYPEEFKQKLFLTKR